MHFFKILLFPLFLKRVTNISLTYFQRYRHDNAHLLQFIIFFIIKEKNLKRSTIYYLHFLQILIEFLKL